jgi:hypothetical protein
MLVLFKHNQGDIQQHTHTCTGTIRNSSDSWALTMEVHTNI